MVKPVHPAQQAGQIQRQRHLQVLFDPSLRGGGGGSEGAGRVCVCVWEGGVGLESELELGDGRKQQMVQLRTNRCRTCSDQRWMLSDELKYEYKIQYH